MGIRIRTEVIKDSYLSIGSLINVNVYDSDNVVSKPRVRSYPRLNRVHMITVLIKGSS